MTIIDAKDELVSLYVERETYFSPGHINSYRRDRYEKWDELTLRIRSIESEFDRCFRL